eukprot:CAMPEP_0171177660 /NCGR_PEP_ID=MMETSP0790-20130122/12352_1 /TAXON_ID=2925 /ORGANISM="Alexandrium catenella, Strain OF101" /LENGTH=304 /DNA_ID=CAMNT_0011642561 /DNA_START=351 /DNA_END=1262 /DNA_ORIENTATION=+
MAFVLLDAHVVGHPNVVVDVEVEERPGLPARLLLDELVEGHVVRDDQVLLDVHEVVQRGRAELGEVRLLELAFALLEERPDGEALLADGAPAVARAVPVGVGDLELLVPPRLLLPLVLLHERPLLLQDALLAVRVVEEGGVHRGVLAKVLPLGRLAPAGGLGVAAAGARGVGVPEGELPAVDAPPEAHLLVALARLLAALDELVDGLALRAELLGGDEAHGLALELLLEDVGVRAAELLVDARELALARLVLDVRALRLRLLLRLLAPLQEPERAAALRARHDLPHVVARLQGADELQRLGRLR